MLIDGAMGEGGGSLVRMSVALSILTGTLVHIKNIRAHRENPGLRTQHLVSVKTIHEMFNGTLSHAEIGSTEIIYTPKLPPTNPSKDFFTIKIDTAGTIALVIQAVRLALALTSHEVSLNFLGGATYGTLAPSVDYIKHVTEPWLFHLFGYQANIEIDKHGFYPKGGAHVLMKIFPRKVLENQQKNDFIDFQPLLAIYGISLASKHLERAQVADRQAKAAEQILKSYFPQKEIHIESEYVDSVCPGSGITLWTEHSTNQYGYSLPLGSSVVGEKHISAEKIGQKSANDLIHEYNARCAADSYLQDQLIPYIALHPPITFSTSKITSHTQTNIDLVEKFLSVKFTKNSRDSANIISTERI